MLICWKFNSDTFQFYFAFLREFCFLIKYVEHICFYLIKMISIKLIIIAYRKCESIQKNVFKQLFNK